MSKETVIEIEAVIDQLEDLKLWAKEMSAKPASHGAVNAAFHEVVLQIKYRIDRLKENLREEREQEDD